MMDREAATISITSEILEEIDTFQGHRTPDDVIVKRIKALCKFKKERAEYNIDLALDAMEKDMKETNKWKIDVK